MKKSKVAAVVAVLTCIGLAVSLVYQNSHYTWMLEQKDKDIDNLHALVDGLILERDMARQEVNDLNNSAKILYNLTQEQAITISELNQTIAQLKEIINGENSALSTIVYHISEKGNTSEFGRCPDVDYVYSQILNVSGPYSVLPLPEYQGNVNWTETYDWLVQHFSDKPIAFSTWEGGEFDTPMVMRNIDEINQACQTLDVRMLRIAEPFSYYMHWNQSVPIEYFREVLTYAKSQNLKVLWSEWKLGEDVYPNITEAIKGFEDIVIFTYQTNNEYDEPVEGYLDASNTFEHWGASVQPWYWVEHGYSSDLMDMPPMKLIQHLTQAINGGAEVIQFEPYWYFFDNDGEPYPVVDLLKAVFSS